MRYVGKHRKHVKRRINDLILVIVNMLILSGIIGALLFLVPAAARAEPDQPVCGVEGLPECAPPPMNSDGGLLIPPEIQCALIAWRTWTPCNAWGIQVPVGTPGSL